METCLEINIWIIFLIWAQYATCVDVLSVDWTLAKLMVRQPKKQNNELLLLSSFLMLKVWSFAVSSFSN